MPRSSAFHKFLRFCQAATVVPSLESLGETVGKGAAVLALGDPTGLCFATALVALSGAAMLDKRKQDKLAESVQDTLVEYVKRQGLQGQKLEQVLIHALDDPSIVDELPPEIGTDPLSAMLAILKAKGDRQEELLKQHAGMVEAIQASLDVHFEEIKGTLGLVADRVEAIDERTKQMQWEFRSGQISSPTIPEGVRDNLHQYGRFQNPNFVGREELLEQLHAKLTGGTDTALRHALCAGGGVGKTEIATHYATTKQYASLWEGIWWLDASDGAIENSIVRLLSELGFQDQATPEQARDQLARRLGSGRHLVILDNVDSEKIVPELRLPPTTRVLITTRLAKLPSGIAETLDVSNLGRPDAMRLLVSKRADLHDGELGPPRHEHEDSINAIAEELGDHALACSITAGAFEYYDHMSPADMLAKLRAAVQEGWVKPFTELAEGDVARGYYQGVAGSLLLHLDELLEVSPEAVAVLVYASLCHSEHIPVSLIAPCINTERDGVDLAIRALRDRSMVEYDPNGGLDCTGSLSLHRLLQSACRAHAGDDLLAKLFNVLLAACNTVFNDPDDHEEWAAQREIEAHVLALAEHSLGVSDAEPLARLLCQVGTLQRHYGRPAQAAECNRKALKMLRSIHAEDHKNIAAALNNIAGCHLDLGQLDKAESASKDALDMSQRLSSMDELALSFCMNGYAAVCTALGRFTQAEALYQDVLNIRRRCLDGRDPRVLTALGNLASTKQALGRYQQAEPLFREVLRAFRQHYRVDHHDVATSINNLAGVLQKLGRLEEALELFEEACGMRRRLHIDGHFDLVNVLQNLAGVQGDLGKYTEAVALYDEALTMCRRLFDSDHPETTRILGNLGCAHLSLGHVVEADGLLQKAFDMERRIHDGDHPRLATSLNNLALSRRALGWVAEADALLFQALKMRTRLYGPDHPDIAQSLHNYAAFKKEHGRLKEAEQIQQQSVDMYKRLFGLAHADTAMSLNALASLRVALHRHREAFAPATEALEAARRSLPQWHPRRKDYERNHAWLLWHLDARQWSPLGLPLRARLRDQETA